MELTRLAEGQSDEAECGVKVERKVKGEIMKLILCAACQDVIKLLVGKQRTCDCGKSWGAYMNDGLNATIGGRAIPIGFANNSLLGAIRCRPESGEGSRFEAFIIPVNCKTITHNIELRGRAL